MTADAPRDDPSSAVLQLIDEYLKAIKDEPHKRRDYCFEIVYRLPGEGDWYWHGPEDDDRPWRAEHPGYLHQWSVACGSLDEALQAHRARLEQAIEDAQGYAREGQEVLLCLESL